MTPLAAEDPAGAAALLLRAAARGRVGHAYLLAGGDRSERQAVARRLAAALLCERQGEGRPCEGCRACRKVAAGNHPDLLWIAPGSSRSGIESLKREAVEDLVGQVWLRPVESGRKVAIVEGADTLTAEAGNALLKTLEEPPGDVVFCLLAEHAGAVLPTLASRCRPVRLPPPAPARDPRADEQARALVRALDGGDEHALLRLSAALEEDRTLALATIDAFARSMRDALLQRLGVGVGTSAGAEPDAGGEAAAWPEARLVSALAATLRVRSQLERNANFRLAVDVWLLSLRPGGQEVIIF